MHMLPPIDASHAYIKGLRNRSPAPAQQAPESRFVGPELGSVYQPVPIWTAWAPCPGSPLVRARTSSGVRVHASACTHLDSLCRRLYGPKTAQALLVYPLQCGMT